MRSVTNVTALLLILRAIASPALAIESKPVTEPVRGVDPKVADRYLPSRNFTCLDGSLQVPFTAVNDDYCDCPDGSDEPGTSACPNARFHCANVGHIPGSVLSSRVNDGICDPECCDGTDEWASGACPNRCAEVGKEYKARKDTEMKTRKTGAKIRGTYIKWAAAEKKRLKDELTEKQSIVAETEKEVEKARLNLERMEAKSKEDLDRKKQSPLYLALLTHRLALTRLRSKTSRLQAELDALRGILEDLAKGYNPNYQDMAVKAAVIGYEEISGVRSATPEGEQSEVKKEDEGEEEIAESELDELERKDLEGLLLLDESDAGDDEEEEEDGILYRIDQYIPDALYDSYESLRDFAIDWLIRAGVIGKGAKASVRGASEGPHVQAAREKHNALTQQLGRINGEIQSITKTLERMTEGYGPEGEWKKLDGTCIDKVSGDYTYEVCFFGKATQKSNKDGSTNHLGTFSEWNNGAEPGSLAHFSTQYYKYGAKCWNGPNRSATVDMSCGTTNALLAISEPEKCEYHFKVTTPALCWPEDDVPVAKTGSGAETWEEESLYEVVRDVKDVREEL